MTSGGKVRALIIAVNSASTRFMAEAENATTFCFTSPTALDLRRGDQVKGEFHALGATRLVQFGNQFIDVEVTIVDQPLAVGLEWMGLMHPESVRHGE